LLTPRFLCCPEKALKINGINKKGHFTSLKPTYIVGESSSYENQTPNIRSAENVY
jgi:hypothetical protein